MFGIGFSAHFDEPRASTIWYTFKSHHTRISRHLMAHFTNIHHSPFVILGFTPKQSLNNSIPAIRAPNVLRNFVLFFNILFFLLSLNIIQCGIGDHEPNRFIFQPLRCHVYFISFGLFKLGLWCCSFVPSQQGYNICAHMLNVMSRTLASTWHTIL